MLLDFAEYSNNPIVQELASALVLLDWSWISAETDKEQLLSYQLFLLQKVYYGEYVSLPTTEEEIANFVPQTSPPSREVDLLWHSHLIRPLSYFHMCNVLVRTMITAVSGRRGETNNGYGYLIAHNPATRNDAYLLKCRRSKLRIDRTMQMLSSPDTLLPHPDYLIRFGKENAEWLKSAQEEEIVHKLCLDTNCPEGHFPIRFHNKGTGRVLQVFARAEETLNSLTDKLRAVIPHHDISEGERIDICFQGQYLNGCFQRSSSLEELGITAESVKTHGFLEFYTVKLQKHRDIC